MMPTTTTTIVDQQSPAHPLIAMSSSAQMSLGRSMMRHWLVLLWALSVLIGFAALLHCSSRAAVAATDASSDASSNDDNPWLLVALVWLTSLSYFLLDLALVATVLLWCHARLYWTGTSLWAIVAYAGAYYNGYGHDDDKVDENSNDDDIDYWAVVEYCGAPPLTASSSKRDRRNGGESSRMMMARSGGSADGSLPLLEPLLTTVEVDEASSAPDEAAIRRRQQPLIVHRKRLDISRSEYDEVTTTMATLPDGNSTSSCSQNTIQIRMLANQPDTAISLGVLRREMRFRGAALFATLVLGLLGLLAVTHYTPQHLLLSSPPDDDDDDDELSFLSSSSSCAFWASFWYNLLPRLIVLPTFVPIADAILHDLARTRQREDFSSSVVVGVTTTTTVVTRSGGTAPAPFPVLV
jgi:hypothetical protein